MQLSPLVGVSLATLALLVGCTAAAPGPTESEVPGPVTSSPSVDGVTSIYYPVALGNTWEYRTDYAGTIGVVMHTEKMVEVTPEGDDTRVTIERSFEYENVALSSFTDSVVYLFHPDGSVSVPYQITPDSTSLVEIHDGEMVWPTTAEFEAGTEKTGVINLTVTTGGTAYDQVVNFTIAGAGIETVTVPAGTYDARKLTQSMLVSIPSAGIDGLAINATVWLAEGVGQVRSEVPDLLGSGSTVVTELLEFTPGG